MDYTNITKEDREFYEEVFGIPLPGMGEGSIALDRDIPFEIGCFADDPLEFIPRAVEMVIDPLMGTSGIEEELTNTSYVERAIQKYEAKLRNAADYAKSHKRKGG